MSKIFISHSSKDKARFVRRLAERLLILGHEAWYDEWSIKPGESLAQRIQDGIAGCDYFLIVVSANSNQSPWVQREVNDALVLDIERGATVVIPVVFGSIENGDIPLTLRARRFIDFRAARGGAYAKVFQELADAVTPLRDTSTDTAPVFSCPTCVDNELKVSDGFHLSVIDIVCMENNVDTGFRYKHTKGEVELFFRIKERISQPIRILLAASHSKQLGVNAKPNLWRVFAQSDGRNGILKLQFTDGRKKLVFLYWINYAIERYIESRVRELAHDWDFEVTLGKQQN